MLWASFAGPSWTPCASDDLSRCETLLDIMDEVYSALVSMDYPEAVTRGLRRSTDMVRGTLERTRGDLTVALRQSRLEKRMAELPTLPIGRDKPQIPHLIGAGHVTHCSLGRDGAPCRGWIPACAGMTEVGDLGQARLLDHPRAL